ncbi:MAG: hypothetical protein IKQ46_03855 [Bacteroidales bacterium]|nr:hypothetical protein [Bacteroidales bacterium]
MRTYQIKKNLRRLNNVEALVFMHSVQKEAESSSDKDIKILLKKFAGNIEYYNSTLMLKNTEEQTTELKNLYAKLRSKYVELKQIARNVVYFPFTIFSADASIRTLAAVINSAIDNITIPKSQSLYTNLGIIKLVMSAVHENLSKDVIEKSGVMDMIDEIDNLIIDIEDIYAQRNERRALRKDKVSIARQYAEYSYKLLVDLISLKAELGDERCQEIVTNINELLVWNGKKPTSCNDVNTDCNDSDFEKDTDDITVDDILNDSLTTNEVKYTDSDVVRDIGNEKG